MLVETTGLLNNDFRAALSNINNYGIKVIPRGSETKELLNYNITLINPRNRIIVFPERKTSTPYLLGELFWYLSGSNSPEGIIPFSGFWKQITNSGDYDGYEKGTINSNYGNRLFGHCGLSALTEYSGYVPTDKMNQWQDTIDLLTRDKDTRQAILNIHLPSDRHYDNKDVACTLSLQFFIREDKLHLIVNMRSNDIILGFTNDVFQFTMLQEIMQVQLKKIYPDLQLGQYFHNAGSLHLYSKHYEMANAIIANEANYDFNMIPMDSFEWEMLDDLLICQNEWLKEKSSDFDFDSLDAFSRLTPYWQVLIKALFTKDEHSMHEMFDLNHDSE